MSNDFVSPTLPPVSQATSRWLRAATVLAFALSALMVIYRTTVASIVSSWSKDPFAHGYVVVPLTLYLVWRRRDEFKTIHPSGGALALPMVASFASLWLLGHLADTGVVQQISLVGMIGGFVWLILGWPAARVLMYPLGCLFFALPLGYRLVPVLQDLAARGAVALLALSGVPVLLQAHVISIPGSTWKVAEACSGINYLTASLAVGYVYAGTTYRDWFHRIGFLLAAALVPLLGNGVRVYGTIFLASKAGPDAVAGTRHFLFGWIVFGSIMALLFVTCGRWREQTGRTIATSSPKPTNSSLATPLVYAALGLVIAALAPALVHRDERGIEPATQTNSPVVSLPWMPTEAGRYVWRPHLENSRGEFVQAYQSDQGVVKLFVAYHSGNQAGTTLSGADDALVPEPWWITGRNQQTVVAQGQSTTVRETFVEGPSSSLVMWNWYWVDGRFAKSDNWARLYLAKAGLFHRSRDSVAIAIATENRPGSQPQTILQNFLLHLSVPAPAIVDRSEFSASNEHP